VENKNGQIVAALFVMVLGISDVQAATYCGWIDSLKFGSILTDKLGVHSLSTAEGDKVGELEEAMKEFPSCGCITGTLNKDGDFSTISGFNLKAIEVCKADKSLEQP
jgi:hypothetical protein